MTSEVEAGFIYEPRAPQPQAPQKEKTVAELLDLLSNTSDGVEKGALRTALALRAATLERDLKSIRQALNPRRETCSLDGLAEDGLIGR